MITYCKKCNINWTSTWSQDIEDETYEYCPKCRSGCFLQPATDIVGYIKCPITGKITNSVTGEEHPAEAPIRPTVRGPRRRKIWDETYEEYQERRDKAQYDLINRYSELKATMSDAEAYAQACQEMEKVERKFHYEDITILN